MGPLARVRELDLFHKFCSNTSTVAVTATEESMTNVYDTMSDQELHRAAQNMERYGGGFATAIAKAFYVADTGNRRLLLGAFGHLFEEYASARWNNG